MSDRLAGSPSPLAFLRGRRSARRPPNHCDEHVQVSHQLESRHFYRTGDRVQDRDGREGQVLQAWSLYAEIRWTDGTQEEVDQFEPKIVVVERAHAA
jgi:hypothetical protein